MPASTFKAGRVGMISRSGTLTYEASAMLAAAGIGCSTVVGIGGDPIIGTTFIDLLPMFNEDPDTDAVVMIGEIGGADEEMAAEWISQTHEKTRDCIYFGTHRAKRQTHGSRGSVDHGQCWYSRKQTRGDGESECACG